MTPLRQIIKYGIKQYNQSVWFLLYVLYILTQVVDTIFYRVNTLGHILTWKIIALSFRPRSIVIICKLILFLLLSLLQSRRRPVFYWRNHRKETFCLSWMLRLIIFLFDSCFLLRYLIISLFLKLNLFRCDSLLVSNSVSARIIVSLIFRNIPALWKLILQIQIHLALSVRMMMKGFIHCILEVELLFTFEKIKDCLIVPHCVPIESALTCWITHNLTILYVIFTFKIFIFDLT